jgi:putative membrane protein
MKRMLTAVAVCLLMCGGLWAQTTLPTTPSPTPDRSGAMHSAPSGQEFVTKVVVSDLFELESSQLALSKQPDQSTKSFAERMVTDHQKTSSELKSLVQSGQVKADLPAKLDAEHQKMLDELKAKNGNEFAQDYHRIQVQAHEDAVALFTAYSTSGDIEQLKAWAGRTLPHLKEHLSMAEKLK